MLETLISSKKPSLGKLPVQKSLVSLVSGPLSKIPRLIGPYEFIPPRARRGSQLHLHLHISHPSNFVSTQYTILCTCIRRDGRVNVTSLSLISMVDWISYRRLCTHTTDRQLCIDKYLSRNVWSLYVHLLLGKRKQKKNRKKII